MSVVSCHAVWASDGLSSSVPQALLACCECGAKGSLRFMGSTIWNGALFNVAYVERSRLWEPPFTSAGCCHSLTHACFSFCWISEEHSFQAWLTLLRSRAADCRLNQIKNPACLQGQTVWNVSVPWLWVAHHRLSSPSQRHFCVAQRKTILTSGRSCKIPFGKMSLCNHYMLTVIFGPNIGISSLSTMSVMVVCIKYWALMQFHSIFYWDKVTNSLT